MKKLEALSKHDLKELEIALRHDMKGLEASLRHDMKELEMRMTLKMGSMLAAAVIILTALTKFL